MWATRKSVTSGVERVAVQSPAIAEWHHLVSNDAKTRLIAAADGLLDGRWHVFGLERIDMADPDWFLDVRTGVRAPSDVNAFTVNTRDPAVSGDIKYVWELSRHHQTALLAAAYACTGDDRYAERATFFVDSWSRQNPYLMGAQWTSGIELGIRLISWIWTRRLLTGWSGHEAAFDANSRFIDQVYAHQVYLDRLPSHGSSANNHLIAELAGQYAAACAFDWFPQSRRWRRESGEALVREIGLQTDADGLNRELATDYHGFVAELVLAAAAEGTLVSDASAQGMHDGIVRMLDALAAMVDVAVHPPRQGDADDGYGYVFDGGWEPGGEHDRWTALLALGDQVYGRMPWWPNVDGGEVSTALLAAACGRIETTADRPELRPNLFSESGMVLLRDLEGSAGEIWCRFDAGPHGFLSIAGHAHADALSIELRVGGIDVLADPGTYTYQGEPDWRRYFISTRGHNVLEVDGQEQSISEGAFLWTHSAVSRLHATSGLSAGEVAVAEASHDGYMRLDEPVTHRRKVELDRVARTVQITDWIEGEGRHNVHLRFHLGPSIDASLTRDMATLRWTGPEGVGQAEVVLPNALEWRVERGETDPISGWYSAAFGDKRPTTVLVGAGVGSGAPFVTVVQL